MKILTPDEAAFLKIFPNGLHEECFVPCKFVYELAEKYKKEDAEMYSRHPTMKN